jgi:hypothetical protein
MNAPSAAAGRAQASLRELLERTFCEIFCMSASDSFLVITRLSHAAWITFLPSCERFLFFAQRLQMDAIGLNLVSQMNEIGEASAEPVELPDNKSVSFPERLEAISGVDGRAWVASVIEVQSPYGS